MATFIPNLRTRAPEAPGNQAFVDTPNFIYADWLTNSGGINGAIGKLSGQSVGIVGAGPAGCVAAFELQKCGARVTLFDAGRSLQHPYQKRLDYRGDQNRLDDAAMAEPQHHHILHLRARR